MTDAAASPSLPGPIDVRPVAGYRASGLSRTETWRDAVATAGRLALYSVDCLRREDSQRSAEGNVEDVIATDGAVAFVSGDTARLAA